MRALIPVLALPLAALGLAARPVGGGLDYRVTLTQREGADPVRARVRVLPSTTGFEVTVVSAPPEVSRERLVARLQPFFYLSGVAPVLRPSEQSLRMAGRTCRTWRVEVPEALHVHAHFAEVGPGTVALSYFSGVFPGQDPHALEIQLEGFQLRPGPVPGEPGQALLETLQRLTGAPLATAPEPLLLSAAPRRPHPAELRRPVPQGIGLLYRVSFRGEGDAAPLTARLRLVPLSPLVTRNRVQRPRLGSFRLEAVAAPREASPAVLVARVGRLMYFAGRSEGLVRLPRTLRMGGRSWPLWQVPIPEGVKATATLTEVSPGLFALASFDGVFPGQDPATLEIQLEEVRLRSGTAPAEEGLALLGTLRRLAIPAGAEARAPEEEYVEAR